MKFQLEFQLGLHSCQKSLVNEFFLFKLIFLLKIFLLKWSFIFLNKINSCLWWVLNGTKRYEIVNIFGTKNGKRNFSICSKVSNRIKKNILKKTFFSESKYFVLIYNSFYFILMENYVLLLFSYLFIPEIL